MKALILVGGFGTRLRPLTFSKPKPLVEFANKAIVEHQMEALVKVGVKEIVLAISYQALFMEEFITSFEKKHGVKVTCSIEYEPMGTAGPIQLAKDILRKDSEEGLFFVFNSDVICEYPLADLIKFHNSHGGEGTIMLTKVEDPSKYGVVIYDSNGKINQFVEKPSVFIGDKINAGLYIFKNKIIDRIPLKPTSIEREIFPVMAAENQLYAMELEGIWMDIGQPKDYLKGHTIYLDLLSKKQPESLRKGANIIGNVLIDEKAKVSEKAKIGPNVVIGPNCVVEDGNFLLFRCQNCEQCCSWGHKNLEWSFY